MTDTSPGDEEHPSGDGTLWSDDVLQRFLDATAKRLKTVRLIADPFYTGSEYEYYTFYTPENVRLERAERPSGTADHTDPLVVRDGTLSPVVDGFTINYQLGQIVFDSDRGSSEVYLDCTVFDLETAASRIWKDKAAQRAELVRWKTGRTELYEDQEYQHCIEMSKKYGGRLNFIPFSSGGYMRY